MRNPIDCLFDGGDNDAFIAECASLAADLKNRERVGFKDVDELTRSLGVCGQIARLARSADPETGRGFAAVKTLAQLMTSVRVRLDESAWIDASHIRNHYDRVAAVKDVLLEDDIETALREAFLTVDLLWCAADVLGEPRLADNATDAMAELMTLEGYRLSSMAEAATRIMKQHNIREADTVYLQWFLLSANQPEKGGPDEK